MVGGGGGGGGGEGVVSSLSALPFSHFSVLFRSRPKSA